jgi:hypothetical protein
MAMPEREPASAPVDRGSKSESDAAAASGLPKPGPLRSEISASQPWACPTCGETVDAGFEVCWSCGTSIEGVEDPSFNIADDTGHADESQIIRYVDDDEEEPTPKPAIDRRTCARCHGPMETGFVADFQTGAGAMTPSQWIAGTPEPSFWTGTWTGDRRFPIRAFRCTQCGLLEFWAGEPDEFV